MIEKDITTWEKFKEAIEEIITDDTTYTITNDLDATNDILEKGFNVKTSFKKIFTSDNKKINGITSYNSINIFNGSSLNINFKNIHFTNFMIQTGGFSKMLNSSNKGNIFEGCLFNGLCSQFSPVSSYSGNLEARFSKCSINVRCNIFATYTYFDSCYVIISPFADYCYFGRLPLVSNCFFSGTVKGSLSNNRDIGRIGDQPGISSSFSCVFNVKAIITNYSTSYRYSAINGYTSEAPNLLNLSKIYQSDGSTNVPSTQLVNTSNGFWLTDEQLKDKDYIQQNTSFPLYG